MKNTNFSCMEIISIAAKFSNQLIDIRTVTATTILHYTKTIKNLCLTDVFVIIVYIIDILTYYQQLYYYYTSRIVEITSGCSIIIFVYYRIQFLIIVCHFTV